MMMRIQALFVLALAATTSASAFLPASAVKGVAANLQQKARFPLANK
jgi:hypothetical protein